MRRIPLRRVSGRPLPPSRGWSSAGSIPGSGRRPGTWPTLGPGTPAADWPAFLGDARERGARGTQATRPGDAAQGAVGQEGDPQLRAQTQPRLALAGGRREVVLVRRLRGRAGISRPPVWTLWPRDPPGGSAPYGWVWPVTLRRRPLGAGPRTPHSLPAAAGSSVPAFVGAGITGAAGRAAGRGVRRRLPGGFI